MAIKELICIGCPMGCSLKVLMENGEAVRVEGHTCRKGEEYGKKECTHPMRTVTSTITLEGGILPRVPVKTKTEIPKEKIRECMEAIHTARAAAPVTIGQCLIENIAGTGVDIVACRDIKRSETDA